ncbi:LysR family transcriptional regulator [Phyllobacterium brassicacearum]|uniref:LysR family transcriptional regulator n=1 Tax=Phyllobacterium brassicacearum TaxID=314235 RepID=A0A2P7BWE0_9HYPH|nr:LysR family transcriptional regulator [Phyllobacterium brassicacearum]PSH70762.1 LysR family transcriptional regulator [Phyllobacterium brassicacearum]TDQ35756.1 DNA-binding transcriptional LysR family regulator [Phyllobacterium brassicacearum]
MDRFAAMNTFVRVAELGTLSAAARELGLTQPAVSQQIAALERHLDVRLFHRSTRKLALTEGGETYYQHALHILRAVGEAEESAGELSSALRGNLRLHGPVGFGQTHLSPIVIEFQRLHPELIIELVLDDRVADLIAEGVDVAIRFGELKSSELIARKLATFERILVASPDYIAEHGNPRTPQDLATHRHVRFIWSPQGEAIPLIGPRGHVAAPVRSTFLANNAFVLNDALCAGLGIGGAQAPLVQALLDEGNLVRVLPEYSYAPMDIHVVYPTTRFLPRKVRVFVDHLESRLSSVAGLRMIRNPERYVE